MTGDHYLTLPEAAARLPGRPDVRTLRRWARCGLAGGVRLPLRRVGGRVYTTEADLAEFQARVDAARSAVPVVVSPRERAARVAAALDELRRQGMRV